MADVPENPHSGAAGTEYQTIRELRNLGHEVGAVWADDLGSKISHGNLHYLVELPRLYEKQLVERFRSSVFDVVHVNQPHGYRAARLLHRINPASIFIHRSHGIEPRIEQELAPWRAIYQQDSRSFPRKIASGVMSKALTRNSSGIATYAHGHIVSTTQCAEFLHRQMNVPTDRIAVIPQAALAEFLSRPAQPMTVKRLRRVLYVSQYAFFKAPMIVSAVINHLMKVENLEFTWVCSREHHDDVRRLLGKAQTRVTLLDWMTQQELIEVYDRHGIFLFPSFVEGFGKVFLEAMARGLCVVAANNSGMRDVISHNIDGFLVQTGSVESLVEHLETITNNLELAGGISVAAAETARKYTWARVANETVEFYSKRLIAARHERYSPSSKHWITAS